MQNDFTKTTNKDTSNWVSYWYYVTTDQLLWFSDEQLKKPVTIARTFEVLTTRNLNQSLQGLSGQRIR